MNIKFKNVIRLYCNQKLSLNNIIVLNKTDTHYLKNVMRCKKNDQINLFNENDQEFYLRTNWIIVRTGQVCINFKSL